MNITTTSRAAQLMAPNANRLLWAGSLSIFAAGIGFAIRGGILDNWGAEFGFSAAELGRIAGAGFTGFCFGIFVGGLICDRVGYGKLVAAAFGLHVLSAVATFSASGEQAFGILFSGMLLFGIANGMLEAVANPLVGTLYPNRRAHYLNILHASWPAALALGGALGWLLDDWLALDWRIQLSLYLLPTAAYGLAFLNQPMPRPYVRGESLRLADRLADVGLLGGLLVCVLVALFAKDTLQFSIAWAIALGACTFLAIGFLTRFAFGSILLFVLFAAHALVGAVELGTDGWIQNITGNILTSEQGKFLFVLTSLTMFALRFGVNFIEQRLGITPVGILVGSAVLACVGLNLASAIEAFGSALTALLIYAIGKTFFWPTMLAVTMDYFPRTGAVAVSIMGGIGMMSAGLIGSPGLGYAKDRFSAEALQTSAPAVYEEYRSHTPSQFLFFEPVYGIDGAKLSELQLAVADARANAPVTADKRVAEAALSAAQRAVREASIAGDRKTLKVDAYIPATLVVIYLGVFIALRRRNRQGVL